MKPIAMITALLTMLVLVFITSCGRDKNSPAPAPNVIGTVKTVEEVYPCPTDDNLVSKVSMSATALIKDSRTVEYFSPNSVTIPVNGIVKWTDGITDTDPYWWWEIISDNKSWSTPPVIKPGNSVCLRFPVPGTYGYHCADWVKGTVVVQ